jgi:mRNA-degrading endonuclease YafQ of YafQ-DinJ toxin-antitoxin module
MFDPKFETQSYFNMKCDEYQSCSTSLDLQLLYGSFFHLTKFEPFKFKILKNGRFDPKFETQNDLNMEHDEYQSCSTSQDLQLLYRSFLHLRN